MKNPRQAQIDSANMRGADRARVAKMVKMAGMPDSPAHSAEAVAASLYPEPSDDDLRAAFVEGWNARF